MDKKRVFITRLIPQSGLDLLNSFDVSINTEDRALTKEELIAGAEGKDAVLCLLADIIDKYVIDSLPTIKIIANYAVGYNNIDVGTATKRKIVVTNTPGVLTETTADLAWALIMSSARRIVEADRFCREGHFKGWAPMLFLGVDVHHKTLGIIGMGRIGQAVAKRAAGFNMKVLYYDENRLEPEREYDLKARFTAFDELIEESDFISLHVPMTPATHHLIGERELGLMKSSAVLINTARGAVIDEVALVNALKSGRIFAAGLDVYENEPEMTPGLACLENVTIPPHIASATVETRTKMAEMAAGNIVAYLTGGIPPNIVNPEVLPGRPSRWN